MQYIPIPPLLYPRDFHEPDLTSIDVTITPGQPATHFEIPPPIIYHYTNLDSAEKIINARSLKFSAPITFNDPFDMYEGLVDFGATETQKKNWAKNTYADKTRRDRRRLQKMTHQAGNKFSVAARHGFTVMKESSGVCCFSKYPNVHLMWSHYADKHKGICFGFDFQPINTRADFVLVIRKAEYIHNIKPINLQSNRDAALDQWLYTKSEVWSYEHEIRALIYDRKGKDFFEFERACLKEIYFGCRVSPQFIDATLVLLERNKFLVSTKKKFIIDDTSFSIKAIDL